MNKERSRITGTLEDIQILVKWRGNMEFDIIFINIFISILVAVITAKLALGGFYKQELWLRKEKKYSEITDKLVLLKKYYGDLFDEFVSNGEIERDVSYEEEYKKAKREIELISLGSNLIINESVIERLERLMKASQHQTKNEIQGDIVSYFDRMYGEVEDTRKEIVKLAKKDLNIL